MKFITIILAFITANVIYGQSETHIRKFRELEPDLWLDIWDKQNSDTTIKIDSLRYDDIPKYLDFRGTVVSSLKWKDVSGEKILIQTVTGHFIWRDYDKDSTSYMLQDKSELRAYLFEKKNKESAFSQSWRIYDYTECFGVDWFTGFIPKATTITDIDNDGISEISMPYVSICRGGMDPGTMKIIMYEGGIKYALRGETMLGCSNQQAYGGEFKASKNLASKSKLMDFLEKRWDAHKCENQRFY
ncbi:M949_RS01915 family surface polysaccharide biosynthesis protein [Aquimarina sediminis]|uniref:M949_RS01915 family surface polysaccharide biosynthesis protein n=1 Tax=Aquimarina sediminis TaxID=2070536 RepID=UPI000CA076C8|nr:hypothetical protein [Aquimarina sediminis]